jgi:hypothetical protein
MPRDPVGPLAHFSILIPVSLLGLVINTAFDSIAASRDEYLGWPRRGGRESLCAF